MNDLRQLKHFVALAEHGHFARAAQAVHLSQPALSRSIQALEHGLKTRLIDRHTRGISLTPQGKLVLEHALRLLTASQAMHNALSQFGNLQRGELKLGAGPYPAARLIPRAIGRLCEQLPKAQIDLKISDWQSLRRLLLEDSIELFVADVRDLQNDPELCITPLTPQRCVLFCRPDHPLLSQAEPDAQAISRYPLAGTQLPSAIGKRLQAFTGHERALTIECDNFMVLKALVAQSDVLSIAPWDVIGDEVHSGQLGALPTLAHYPIEYSAYGLVTRLGYSLAPLAQAMCEHILAEDQCLRHCAPLQAMAAHDASVHPLHAPAQVAPA